MAHPSEQKWQWVKTRNLTMPLIVNKSMTDVNGYTPADKTYQTESPEEVITLTAKKVPQDDTEAIRANCRVIGVTQSYTASDGEVVTGIFTGLSEANLEGTLNYNLTVTLRIPYAG